MNNKLKCVFLFTVLESVINIFFSIFLDNPIDHYILHTIINRTQIYLHFLQNCTNIWTEGVSFEWFHPLSNNNPGSLTLPFCKFTTNLGINHSKKKKQENGKLESSLFSLSIIPFFESSAFEIVQSIIMVRLKYTLQKKKKMGGGGGFVIVVPFCCWQNPNRR